MRYLILLFFSFSVHASFSGSIKSSNDYYPVDLGEPTDTLVPYLSLDLGGKHKFTKKFRLQWRAFLMGNLESEYDPERFYYDLPEGFFEYKLPADLRFRIGMNTFNWGVVDISSPSDTVNSTAFFHPMRSLKRGAPAVELDWDKEVFGIHAIYIPRQQKSLLPSEDSRWLPRTLLLNLSNGIERITLPDFLEYKYDSDIILDKALDHNGGARISSHLGSWDLFLSHFEGASPSPKVFPTLVVDLGGVNEARARSPIRLAPIYYRIRTTGGGFVYASEKWIFRAESAYQHSISDSPLVQPWSWNSVAALETNLDVSSKTITILGQYYHAENPQAADNVISSSYRLFDRTGVLGARFAWSEKLLLMGSALFETNAGGLFWMMAFEQKMTDVLKFGLGWRDFSAREEGLIKTFDRNDHATFDLTYYF